jgi:hypothetical protein
MKKFLVLSFVSLLILAFGMTAYAQEKKPVLEFKASGWIDMVTEWWRNAVQGTYGPDGTVPAAGIQQANKTAAYLETRARLKFDAIYGKAMSGTIYFEMDSSRWGDMGSGRNNMGAWNADQVALEIKNVYFDFAVPYFGVPVPTTFRVGLQPLSIRNHLLVYTDGMGITMGAKIADMVTVSPFFFKPKEGQDLNSDDVDVYGIQASAKVSTMNVGGYWMYYNMNLYPLNANSAYGVGSDFKSDMNWWGLYADGKLGPVNMKTDFIYDWGNVHARNPGVGDHRVKYSGYCLYGNFDFPWEKFNFGATGMWTSAADADETSGGQIGSSTSGLPYTQAASTLPNPAVFKPVRRVGTYVVPPGSESGAIFGEGLVFYSSWVNRGNTGIGNTINSNGLGRGPVGGTYMIKAYTGFKFHPDHKITLAGMYIGDNVNHGDLYGTYINDNLTLRDKDTIGVEVDAIWEWNIYDKLKYTVGAGYMWPGTAIKYQTYSATDRNNKLHAPWIVTSQLIYSF